MFCDKDSLNGAKTVLKTCQFAVQNFCNYFYFPVQSMSSWFMHLITHMLKRRQKGLTLRQKELDLFVCG